MDKEEEKVLLDQLEQELGVDTAVAEYYANMAFDDRLLALLKSEIAHTRIKTVGLTTQPLNSNIFIPNHSETIDFLIDKYTTAQIDVKGFLFKAEGTVECKDDASLIIDATIASDLDDDSPIHITSSPRDKDEFLVYKDSFDGIVSEKITKKELLFLIGSLCNMEPFDLSQLLSRLPEKERQNPRMLNDLIEQLWATLGERGGSKKIVRTLALAKPSVDAAATQEEIRLTYIEEETPRESLIHMLLEDIKEFAPLDASDIHSLRLTFSSVDSFFDQTAERHVVSGMPLRLVGIDGIHMTSGRKTQLNLTDPEIVKQFVDWFDELVAA